METGDTVKLFNKACGKVLDVMKNGTENGTCCLAWMTDSSSFAGIISWWYIATATYSAGNVSEIASAKYRSTISAEASR